MVLGSASQPIRPSSVPRASGEPNPASSSRNGSLSRTTLPMHEERAVFLSQPVRSSSVDHRAFSTGCQEEADKAEARRARRQRRIEEKAYKINGWEDLYGGNGFKPVYSRQDQPAQRRRLPESSIDEVSSRRNAAYAAGIASSNRSMRSQAQSTITQRISGADRQNESRSEQGTEGSANGSLFTPSTIIVSPLNTTADLPAVRLGKRKTPLASPQPSSGSSGPLVRSHMDAVPEGQNSDAEFEIVGVTGPAAKRSRVDDLNTMALIKTSQSPDEALKSTQLTVDSRRSVSQAPAHGPAASALPSENGCVSSTSSFTAREGSRSRQSSESSASDTTGSSDLTSQHAEAVTENTRKALTQGVSLVDHLRNVLQVYADTVSVTHRHRTVVDHVQRKLADLGSHATISDIQLAVQDAPKRLARRFSIAIRAYESFGTRDSDAQHPNTATTSASTIGTNTVDVTEGDMHHGGAPVAPAGVTDVPNLAVPATVMSKPAELAMELDRTSGASTFSSAESPQALAIPPQHLQAAMEPREKLVPKEPEEPEVSYGHPQAEQVDELGDEVTEQPVQDGHKTATQPFQADRDNEAHKGEVAVADDADKGDQQPATHDEPASVEVIAGDPVATGDLLTYDGEPPADGHTAGGQQMNDDNQTLLIEAAATHNHRVGADHATLGDVAEADSETLQQRQLAGSETSGVVVLDSLPSPNTVAAPPDSGSMPHAAAATRTLHDIAAEAVLSAITDATSTINRTLIDVDEPPAATSAQRKQEQTAEAGTGDEVTATSTAETESETDPLRETQLRESARSRSMSGTHVGGKHKMTISDRMKSMLKDLSTVTKRESSYDTIQKLKPRRAGLSTDGTVRDLVEKWQNPAKMIPWTCLQDLGPNIFHRNAHCHLHRPMHELMDEVSNTRSVKHLVAKVPVRVMTRALMEFPRIPHMLQCWTEEKSKYFAARGLPEPTDTQPEFRFADGELEPSSSFSVASAAPPALASRGSAPLPTTMAELHSGLRSSGLQSSTSSVHPQQLVSPVWLQAGRTPMQPSESSAAFLATASSQAVQRVLPQSVGLSSALTSQEQVYTPPAQSLVYSPEQRNMMHAPTDYQPQQRMQPHIMPHRPALEIAQLRRQQQQQQQQSQQQSRQSTAALFAATVRKATEQMFSGLVADCLSFAEHVVGTNATVAMVGNHHFAESDVLHVVDYVVKVYQKEVTTERNLNGQNLRAEQRYAKVLKVQNAARHVLTLTKMLMGVRMCINETASNSLRSTGVASTQDWQEQLWTSSKWQSIAEYLVQEETGWKLLSRTERHMLLHSKVVRMNKELETTLEKMTDVDELLGAGEHGDEESEEQIRKECEQIAAICCKHVVDILGDSDPSSHSR